MIKGMLQCSTFQIGEHVGVLIEARAGTTEEAHELAQVLRMKLDILVGLAGGLPVWEKSSQFMEDVTFEEAIQEIARTFLRSE